MSEPTKKRTLVDFSPLGLLAIGDGIPWGEQPGVGRQRGSVGRVVAQVEVQHAHQAVGAHVQLRAVRLEHQRRPPGTGDDVGHRERLAGAGDHADQQGSRWRP